MPIPFLHTCKPWFLFQYSNPENEIKRNLSLDKKKKKIRVGAIISVFRGHITFTYSVIAKISSRNEILALTIRSPPVKPYHAVGDWDLKWSLEKGTW